MVTETTEERQARLRELNVSFFDALVGDGTGMPQEATTAQTNPVGVVPAQEANGTAIASASIPTIPTPPQLSPEEQLADVENRIQDVENRIVEVEGRIRANNIAFEEYREGRIQRDNLLQERNDLQQQRERFRQSVSLLANSANQWNTIMSTYQPQQAYRYVDFSVGPASPVLAKPIQPHPADDPVKIKKIHENLMVDTVQVDSHKRILVTTKAVYIKKKEWKRKRKAGIYQIRIDFSQKQWNSASAIQIINTTRCDGSYYHPNIDGFICWGTMAGDVEDDFNRYDPLEVVTDCIDFIQSTNDREAFRWDDDGDEGWLRFFKDSRRRKTSFDDAEGVSF